MKKVPQGQRREADVTAVVSSGSGRAHYELTPWQRKRGSLKDAKQLAPWSVGSRKVGPINGETIDDLSITYSSGVLRSMGFPSQAQLPASSARENPGPPTRRGKDTCRPYHSKRRPSWLTKTTQWDGSVQGTAHLCLEWLIQALVCAIRNAYAKSKWKNMPASGSDKSIAVRRADLWINTTHILTWISLFPLAGLVEIGLARTILGSARSQL